MKNTAFKNLIIIICLFMAFISCSKDEKKDSDEPSISEFSLTFNVVTNQDQMGNFSHNKMVVFNDEVWSIGGYNDYNNGLSSDIWKSENGANWLSVTRNEFPNRINHTLTVYDNKMWVIGGFTENTPGNLTTLNDVWFSSDGETWSLATDDLLSGANVGFHSTVVFNNKLYLIKDGYNESAPGCTVWSSNNGIDWTQETNNAFSYRDDFDAIVFNDELYVIGGSWESSFFNEIWKSTDGINWSQVNTGSSIFSSRAGSESIIYENKLWVFGGRNGTSTITNMGLWYSNNGSSWSRYEPLPSEDGIQDFSALTFENAIWVFGGMHQEEGSSLRNRVGTINTIKQD